MSVMKALSTTKIEFMVPKDVRDLVDSLNWPEDHQTTLRLLETMKWWSRLGRKHCGITFEHALASDILELFAMNTEICELLYCAPRWMNKEVHYSDWWPRLKFKPEELGDMLLQSNPDFGVVFIEEREPKCMLFLADIEWLRDGTVEYAVKAMYSDMVPSSSPGWKNSLPLRKPRDLGAEWPSSIIWAEKEGPSGPEGAEVGE